MAAQAQKRWRKGRKSGGQWRMEMKSRASLLCAHLCSEAEALNLSSR